MKNKENVINNISSIVILIIAVFGVCVILTWHLFNKNDAIETYNTSKDTYINSLIIKPPIKIERKDWMYRGAIQYYLWYDTCRLIIDHYPQLDYTQKERWEYELSFKSGDSWRIMTLFDIPEHKLSGETYTKIQNICLEYEQLLK